MLRMKQLIMEQNTACDMEYQQLIGTINTIWNDTVEAETPLLRFAFGIVDLLVKAIELEALFTDRHYLEHTIEELEEENKQRYQSTTAENYTRSYANPDYCVSLFGKERGPVLAAIYNTYRFLHYSACDHKRYTLLRWMKYAVTLHELCAAGTEDATVFSQSYSAIQKNMNAKHSLVNELESYQPNANGLVEFIKTADLNDPRYLYHYGIYISENERKLSEYAAQLSQEKVNELAEMMVKAYIRGFSLARKDLSKKSTVRIYFMCGLERFIKATLPLFEAAGLHPVIATPGTTPVNRQVGYDHRFDSAIYYDKEYVENHIAVMKENYETAQEFLKGYSGTLYFDRFGETPFQPQQKEHCLKLNKEQQQLRKEFSLSWNELRKQYMPREETSFCIIGFPVPEIGPRFAEIFEDTIGINAIDTEHHEAIQHHLVEVLDKAEYVHVKGKNGNLTDIRVQMQKLADPAVHTNFVNCGADVNIPVGEVFTSPQLTGTNGVLHLKQSFLNDLEFTNLHLTFKDGYVADYSCKNFDDEEKNRQFIQENLLFPHKTLPIGEFAIGTNTQAYRMAKKYDIVSLLPILIVEKMGPHFAIGDTCFSWEEDFAVFNPIDGKEITARDNEHSIKRKTSLKDAYTNCHTDITLPYEDLDFITAVAADGTTYDIIRNGRFVVAGTEELNIPLDALTGAEA
jgi:leucyl aminopeptidase (aminopeptidase T)